MNNACIKKYFMEKLFNQEWFIQTLIEYILNHGFMIIECKNKLVRNILRINSVCFHFGIKQSVYNLISTKLRLLGYNYEDPQEFDYDKEYNFKSYSELMTSLNKLIQDNKEEYLRFHVIFSAYRYYKFRNGSEICIRKYFEYIDVHTLSLID